MTRTIGYGVWKLPRKRRKDNDEQQKRKENKLYYVDSTCLHR